MQFHITKRDKNDTLTYLYLTNSLYNEMTYLEDIILTELTCKSDVSKSISNTIIYHLGKYNFKAIEFGLYIINTKTKSELYDLVKLTYIQTNDNINLYYQTYKNQGFDNENLNFIISM